MSRNKTALFIALAMSAMGCYAQQSSETTITLDEYAKILAAKMKQGEPDAKSTPPATKPAPGTMDYRVRAVSPVNPFSGWIYNGATVETSSLRPLFGELIVGGRTSTVYNGDIVSQVWRVNLVSEQTIEFNNTTCAPPTNTKKKVASKAACKYQLTRRS